MFGWFKRKNKPCDLFLLEVNKKVFEGWVILCIIDYMIDTILVKRTPAEFYVTCSNCDQEHRFKNVMDFVKVHMGN